MSETVKIEAVQKPIAAETAKEKLAAKKEEREKPIEVTSKPEENKERSVASAKKEEVKKEEKKGEKKEKVEYVLQRKAVVPLVDAYAKPAKKRAGRAIKLLRQYAARHTKSPIENVKIDPKLSEFINARGSKKPPKKLKVSLLKDKQGKVTVVPA